MQPVPSHAARRVLTPPRLPDPPARPAAAAAPAPLDDDEVFRQIVAGFDTTGDDPVPRWPVSEDTDGPRGARRPAPPPTARRPRAPPAPRRRRPAGLARARQARARAGGPGADDHYVPPPPPPVPRVNVRTVGAVALLVLGLVLLFVPALLRQSETPGTILLGVVLLVGGAAALVLRVRDAPPHDSGPDDGAVV